MLQTIAIYSRHDLGHPDDIVLSSFVGTESEKFNRLCVVVEDDSSCALAGASSACSIGTTCSIEPGT